MYIFKKAKKNHRNILFAKQTAVQRNYMFWRHYTIYFLGSTRYSNVLLQTTTHTGNFSSPIFWLQIWNPEPLERNFWILRPRSDDDFHMHTPVLEPNRVPEPVGTRAAPPAQVCAAHTGQLSALCHPKETPLMSAQPGREVKMYNFKPFYNALKNH